MRKNVRTYLLNCFFATLCLLPFKQGFAQQLCPPNIDFEEGSFNNWQCYAGKVSTIGGNNTIIMNPTPPLPNHHFLLGPANAGEVDQYGGFPVLCPNGSNYALKLGTNAAGSEAEGVSYNFVIPSGANIYSLVYNYAVVFQNPPHTPDEQPRFIAKVYDVATNTVISCANFDFVATGNLPGFTLSPVLAPSTATPDVWYKPWTAVTINLSGMSGRTIRVEFTTTDCTRNGHFGYAYVDVNANCTSPILGSTICPGVDSVKLTAPFGYKSYAWFDNTFSHQLDTGVSIVLKPVPAANTVYGVVIEPYDGYGCRDTLFATLKVGVSPTADAGQDLQLCPGKTGQLGTSNPVAGYTYSWYPALNLSRTNIANPVYTTVAGIKNDTTNYTLTVTNLLGCSKTDTVTVINYTKPAAAFSINNTTQCLDGNIFTIAHNLSPNYSYSWDYGDGTIVTNIQPTDYSYKKAGSFSLALKTTNKEGCENTAMQAVKVNAMPVAIAGSPLSLCEDASGQLGAASVSGNSYQWLPGTYLSNASVSDPVVKPVGMTQSESINYLLTVTNTATGCVKKDSVTVKLTAKPSTSFTVNAKEQCFDNNNFVFTNSTPSNVVYTWSFGDNSTSNSATPPAHRYVKDGTYSVSLSGSSGPGCADTATMNIIVHPMPTGTLTAASPIICEGVPVPLIVKGGNVSLYNWYYNNTALSSPHDSVFNALQGGNYKVDMVSQYGCKTAASSIQLSLVKKPVTDFSYNQYCIGLPTKFINQTTTAGSGAVNYSWKFGNDDSSAVIDPIVSYNKPGLYKVRLTATPQQCPDIAVTKERGVLIEVPRKGVTYDPKNAVANTPLLLEARTFGMDYLWSPAINLTSTNTPATIYQGATEQLYTVKITAASGCVTVDSQRVYLFVTTDIQVPKGFTPNGDGQNDKIYPFLVGVSQLKYFRIINRWGVVVYQSVTDLPGWDGTYKGQPQPMDGYVWEAEAIDVNGKAIKRSGNLTLIR